MAFEFNPLTGNLDIIVEKEILKGSSSAIESASDESITELDLSALSCDAFDIQLLAKLDATSNDIIKYDLTVINTGTDYVIVQEQHKQNSLGITFTVTSAGQIQYSSQAYTGFTSLDFSWKIIKL